MSGVVPTKAASSFLSAADIDLSSSAGMQQFLSLLRKTPMVRDDYNEIRDLVLTYKQTGGDEQTKQAIFSLLTESGLLTSAATEEPPAVTNTVAETESAKAPIKHHTAPSNSLGRKRQSPTFSPAVKKVTVQSPSVSIPVVPPAPVAPSEKKPTPVPEVVTAAAEPLTEPESEAVVPKQVPAPAASVPAPSDAITYSDPLERIKAIKQAVNKRVGNPVNLIDANNEVGREYMTSLLEAMKKVNSGDGGINDAMLRLEAAFTAVQKTLDENPSVKEVDKKPQTESVTMSESEPASSPVKENSQELSQESNEEEVESEDVTTNSVPVIPPQQTSETESGNKISSPYIPKVAPEAVSEPILPRKVPDSVPNKGLPKSVLFGASDDTESVDNIIDKNDGQGMLQSVAKEKQVENMMQANQRQSIADSKRQEQAEIAKMDPLLVPDITNGLQQLLSEWNLFKSSGIFGTGPNGMEHPLYKKIAGLQMSALIAGRFEGATPEVKQSITDYMNGWRYEEGIIHQHGETFEHYLRRVIKKILERNPGPNV